MCVMSEQIPLSVQQPEGETRSERSDAAANRARILAAAKRLFAEKGVPAVHMAEIAEAAGVGKGTLYRRFCNKGELALSLMDAQLKQFQDEQLASMRRMTAAGVPFLEQLGHFLEALVSFTETHMSLLYEAQQHTQALDEEEVSRPHFWQYMTAHALLRRAVEAGELPDDLDTAYAAEALLAPLSAETFRFQTEHLGFSTERIATGLRMMVRGLGNL